MLKPPKLWNNINILSLLLYPLSVLYLWISKVRYFFQTPQRHRNKVICIGNVTLGGSGKTPIAIALGKLLISKKYKIAYACKNYGASIKEPTKVNSSHNAREVIDEAILLSKIATTFISDKRTKAISAASQDADIVIVDDGFQNNSFKKDLSILAVPPDENFGNNFIFPAGPLRESLTDGLKKADLVFIMNETKDSHKKNRAAVEKSFSKEKILQTRAHYKLCGPKRKTYLAFCSIATPSNFFKTLKNQKIKTLKETSYPDHHHYTKKDLSKLQLQARKLNAGLITTEKDLVKLSKIQRKEMSFLKLDLIIDKKKLSDMSVLFNGKFWK